MRNTPFSPQPPLLRKMVFIDQATVMPFGFRNTPSAFQRLAENRHDWVSLGIYCSVTNQKDNYRGATSWGLYKISEKGANCLF